MDLRFCQRWLRRILSYERRTVRVKLTDVSAEYSASIFWLEDQEMMKLARNRHQAENCGLRAGTFRKDL